LKILEIQTDQNGFKYYESLPEGWKAASESDFFNEDDLFIIGKPFLIHSYHSNRFECYRIRSKESFARLRPWIDDGRVYVLK
jgi:hypothetical protein